MKSLYDVEHSNLLDESHFQQILDDVAHGGVSFIPIDTSFLDALITLEEVVLAVSRAKCD